MQPPADAVLNVRFLLRVWTLPLKPPDDSKRLLPSGSGPCGATFYEGVSKGDSWVTVMNLRFEVAVCSEVSTVLPTIA